MKLIQQLVLTAASVGTLVACSGGNSPTTQDTTYPNTAKYLGTWNGACDTVSDIQANGATGANIIWSSSLTSNTATTVSGVNTIKVYGNSDFACAGAQVGSMARNVTMTVDGVGTGPSGSDKITAVVQNSAISGNSVSLTSGANTVIYTNGTTLGYTTKDLAKVSATTITFGDSSTAANANSYPTALGTSIYEVLTKQ